MHSPQHPGPAVFTIPWPTTITKESLVIIAGHPMATASENADSAASRVRWTPLAWPKQGHTVLAGVLR